MKKLFLALCALLVCTTDLRAENMVKREDVLKRNLTISALPDFPPFSFAETTQQTGGITTCEIKSVFFEPIREAMKDYSFSIHYYSVNQDDCSNIPMFIQMVRGGNINLFAGALSDTKLFAGLGLIYPAAVANPIHVITTPDNLEKIKSAADLKNLKGLVCKQEYFSDFVMRKIQSLNIIFVETPYEAYEKLFTGEVDYIIGSAYYNRIMSSRYGLNRYLAYSKKPLFKIPVFIALSKVTPLYDEYMKVFSKELAKPEFAMAVKRGIIRVITEETTKNEGVVPPAFVKDAVVVDKDDETTENLTDTQVQSLGHIIENKVQEKSIDEMLEGI